MKKFIIITVLLYCPINAVVTRVTITQENQKKMSVFYDARQMQSIPNIDEYKTENRLFIVHFKYDQYTERFWTIENNDDIKELTNSFKNNITFGYIDCIGEQEKSSIVTKPEKMKVDLGPI